jgi:predicted permease
MVLALLGGVAGIALASWGVAAIRATSVQFLPRQYEIGMNPTVVAFSLALAVGTGLLFGLAPAVRLTRDSLRASLHEGARGATGGALARLRSTLVLAEVALAMVLLVGAGLLVRSFDKLTRVDLGFEPAGVLTYSVTIPSAKFPDVAQLPAIYQSVLERSRALANVRSVGLSTSLPMAEAGYWSYSIEGEPPRTPTPDGPPVDVQPFTVSADYFETLRIPLRRGRLLQPTDGAAAAGVAVINDEMVRRVFGDRDPIGRRITFGNPTDSTTQWMTIVGVVGDVAQEGVSAKPYPQLYAPIDQNPGRNVIVSIRTDRDPLLLAQAARGAVRAVDRDLVVNDVQPLEARVAQSLARPRLSVWLLAGFAGVALLLAAIGIYGVMAYTVAQRTREIGVRMALGADPMGVKRLVVWQGMQPALIGVGIGMVAAFAASRFIASLLYGVSALDPVTFVLVPFFLATIALLATYVPARRATRVSPTVALQSE